MLDATSKLPSGILYGNIKDYGNFEECLEIEGPENAGEKIVGKHCLTFVNVIDLISGVSWSIQP